MTIKTSDSIRYLGAEIIANKEENKSTFIIQTNKIAREITNRCNVIKNYGNSEFKREYSNKRVTPS